MKNENPFEDSEPTEDEIKEAERFARKASPGAFALFTADEDNVRQEDGEV